MMNYVELNAAHIKAMRGICHNSTDFEWEDSDILKYCAGELPRIRHFSMKADVREKESALEKEYRKYKFFATSPADFLKSIETKLNDLYSVDKYWSGLHLSQVEDVIRLQKFCLISGEGGIGKSFFVKCLEEELTKNKTKHLCVYGKFCKDVDIINFEEIKHLGLTEEIVFVFDAINEIDESNQLKLLNKLQDMKKVRGVRIIVSYRNHTVNTDILEKYQKLSEFQYDFPGVSFESVLEWLQKEAIVDINEYVDVIYSNNPLLLSQLPYILPDKKEKNNISRQTYIYEQYIKRVLDRDTWLKTKVLAKFLYDNNKKYFTIEELTSLICEPLTYIFRMQQQGFVHQIRSDDVETYSFSIDTMSDFLISRNLLDDLKDKDTEDIIKIINDKLESFYSINRETVILLIFDKLAPDFATIREILYATDLINNMTYDSLTKMHFSESDIACFLKEFKVANNAELILHFAGFINKPFNCTNYLNDYYLKYPEKQSIELSRQLSGKYIYGMLLGRLKNIIYFTAKCEITLERARENLYTSIWCSAACNPDIRNISTKLLYETLEKRPCLIEETVELFPKIHDCYIQESIIAVLSSLPERDSVVCLFNSILASYDFTMARSIKRMSSYLKTPYSYIELRKQNLLKSENDNISEDFTSYLHKVNLMEKELLPFRFWGENRIETSTKFLQEDKDIIKKFNADLASKFACVETGVCNGTMTFQKKVEK